MKIFNCGVSGDNATNGLLRLEETAKVADDLGFDYFCTSLTLSPYKKTDWLNEIGESLNDKYN